MTLEDLIARRDALLAELTVVRADIKTAKAASAAEARAAAADKPKPMYVSDRKNEALAMRRSGMKYRDIAAAIGANSTQYARNLVISALYKEVDAAGHPEELFFSVLREKKREL